MRQPADFMDRRYFWDKAYGMDIDFAFLCDYADNPGKINLEAQTKDAAWAVEKGIVHEVREVQMQTGAPVITLVFQRQSR